MKKGTTSKSGPVAGRSSSPSPTKKVATESTVKTTKRTLRDGKQNGTKESSGTGLIESNLLFYYHVAPKAGSSSAAPGTSSSAKSKGAVTKKRKLH